MHALIILIYKNKENQNTEKAFLDGNEIELSSIDNYDNLIVEKINLDSYVNAKEKELFLKKENCKILCLEQEMILKHEIDQAFFSIQQRVTRNSDIEKSLLCDYVDIKVELDRYQDMTQEVLNYIVKHQDTKEVNEIYDIIKKWAC